MNRATKQKAWITRHGTRIDVAEPTWRQTAERAFDPWLAPQGEREAEQLASDLAEEPFSVIYCSPFLRAVQTAAPIARAKGLVIRIEPGLGEWMHAAWFTEYPSLLPTHPHEELQGLLDPDYRSPCVGCYPETWEDVAVRTRETIRRLAAHGESFLAVGHGASVVGSVAGLLDWQCIHDPVPPPLATPFALEREEQGWRLLPGSVDFTFSESPSVSPDQGR